MLKQDYKEGLSLEEAKALAVKILSKTLDTTKLSPEKCKLFIVTLFLSLIYLMYNF